MLATQEINSPSFQASDVMKIFCDGVVFAKQRSNDGWEPVQSSPGRERKRRPGNPKKWMYRNVAKESQTARVDRADAGGDVTSIRSRLAKIVQSQFKTRDNNPYKIKPVDAPVVANAIIDHVVGVKEKNSFKRPSLRQVFEAVQKDSPDLTVSKFHGVLLKMAKDGKIRLDPYTQGVNSIPDEHVPFIMPLDMDLKNYVDLGMKHDAKSPPEKY